MKVFKKQRISSAVVAAIASAGVWAGFPQQVSAQSSGPNLHDPAEIRYVVGRVLVQPRAGLSVQELDKKLKVHGGRRVGAIAAINVQIVELPSQANPQAVAQMLRADRHIKFAEIDAHLPPSLTPNDPSYTKAWHLPKIGTPDAWNYAVGDAVTIAILDSGVDAAHPDLAASVVPGYNFYSNNTDTRDVYGHGTWVAGTAAMAGNNLVGGTGVAFKSRIMPIRVTDTQGWGSVSAMANGLVWAADHGARVANLSFRNVCLHSTILSAAAYMRSKGGVVTGAAGNTGTMEAIAPSDSITCVSALDSTDNKASFSSYGDYVDVAAPGVSIYTTSNGGGYGSVSGTSFSAPVTAGVYALMMSANRSLAPSQLDSALFSTAVDLGSSGKDVLYGYGRVDASAAVAKVRSTTSTADTTAPTASFSSPAAGAKVTGLVAVDAKASDNVGVTRVDLYAGGKLVGSDNAAPYAFSWDTAGLPDGDLTLEARAVDAAGNVGSAKLTVSIGNDTSPPSVSIGNPQPGAVVSSAITVTANASDDKSVAKISLKINGSEVALSYGSTLSYNWDPYAGKRKGRGKGPDKNTSGTSTITATATDTAGNTRSASVSVTVP